MDMTRKWTPMRIAAVAILMVVVVLALIPLVWMIASSFKTDGEFMLNPFGLPKAPTLHNYAQAWLKGDFPTYFRNSLLVAALSLVVMIGTGSMVAYAVTRFRRIHYRNKLMFFFIIGQMISAQVILISVYLVLVQYRLIDNLVGLSFVYVASGLPFVIFMLSGFFESLPFELYEAANIDGYNDWQIFARIALPLAKPAVATAFIIQFLYVWNEFVLALITIRSPLNTTLPVGIFRTVKDLYSTSYVTACAGLAITGIPTLVVYAVFQKQIIFGMAAGAIKG
jgi:multiple sugar transport system permease protein/raffinose/stachyose/melibiose transport system permease protein/N-acetylglucosamine transport system permease protein